MRLFLTAKHWQVFIVLFIALVLGNIAFGGKPEISAAVRVTGFLMSFAWQLSIGHGLYRFLPAKVEMKYNLFIINWFVVMVAVCAATIYSDGEGMTFTGVAALPGLYVVFAFLHMLIFPAKLLTSVEMSKEAYFGDYIVTLLLMILWPIGVWFIQPRINEVLIQAGDEN